MKTREELTGIAKEKFRDIEECLNALELEIKENGEGFNKPAVSFYIGKIYNDYKYIMELLDINLSE